MKQSRSMSLIEAIANVVIGYGIAVATQMLVLPAFGLHMTLAQNLKLATAFTFISIIRSFALRRLFEAIRAQKGEREGGVRRAVALRRESCKPAHVRRPFPKQHPAPASSSGPRR